MQLTEGLAIAVVSAVVGSAATMFASSLTYFKSSRELDIKMVEVALNILSSKEKGTDTLQARRYALRSLEKYGGVDIPDGEFEDWVETGTVPLRAGSALDMLLGSSASMVALRKNSTCAHGYSVQTAAGTDVCVDESTIRASPLPDPDESKN